MSREIEPQPTEPTARTRTSKCSPTCSPTVKIVKIVTIALCLGIAASGCLASGRSKIDPADVDDSAVRATKIEALKAAIERDHRTLENLITQPSLAADRSLHENPELRAIAERLTAQERALEELKSGSLGTAN